MRRSTVFLARAGAGAILWCGLVCASQAVALSGIQDQSQVDARAPLPPRQAQKEIEALDRAEAAQRSSLTARIPLVAQGLQLPDEDGVFVLDPYQGLPELVHLKQANGDRNQDPYHSVHPVKIEQLHGLRAVVRMPGPRAQVEVHTLQPVFYVRLRSHADVPADDALVVHVPEMPEEHEPGGSADSHFFLVPVAERRGERVLRALQLRDLGPDKIAVELLPGQPVPLHRRVLPGGDWMELRPGQNLSTGQYVLVEMLSQTDVNQDVWAFGVDPDAPENRHPRTPVQP